MAEKLSWEALLARAVSAMAEYALVATDPVANTSPNPPATEQNIENAEISLGMKLPEDFREFLRRADGWGHFAFGWRILSAGELRDRVFSERINFEGLREDLGIKTETEGGCVAIGGSDFTRTTFFWVQDGSLGSGYCWFDSELVAFYSTFKELFVDQVEGLEEFNRSRR
jgi:hypothetical protein